MPDPRRSLLTHAGDWCTRRKLLAVGGAVGVLATAGIVNSAASRDAESVSTTTPTTTVGPPTTARPTTAEVVVTAPPTTVPSTTAAPTTPAPTTAVPASAAPTTLPAVTVTAVVDGDTLDLSTGQRVRIIGIDTPEAGQCGSGTASARLRALVSGKAVAVTSGARDDVDNYGRILRYIDVDGVDVGLILINEGQAIARYDSRDGYGRHPREGTYVAADTASASAHVCSPPPTTAPMPAPAPRSSVTERPATPSGCDTNYSGCVPIASDVDCAGGSGNGPAYVRGPVQVIGSDIYGLDRDGNGIACQ